MSEKLWGFKKEGTYRKHAFVNGKYIDTYTLSLFREKWKGKFRKLNNNLTTAKTLSNLNINENTLKEFHKKDLLEKGYCLIHLTDNE